MHKLLSISDQFELQQYLARQIYMDAIVEGNFFPEMPEQRAIVFTAKPVSQSFIGQPYGENSDVNGPLAANGKPTTSTTVSKPVQLYRTSSRGDRELMAFHPMKKEELLATLVQSKAPAQPTTTAVESTTER